MDTARTLVRLARWWTAELGLNGFTVEQLCAEAGVSRRTFFNYFASKDDAVLGIPLKRNEEEAVKAFVAAGRCPAGAGGLSPTLLADLVRLSTERWSALDIAPDTARERVGAVQREPRLLARVLEHLHRQQTEDVEMVCRREGLPAGDLRAQAAVQLIEAISRAATCEYLDPGNTEPFTRIFERRIGAARDLFVTQTVPIEPDYDPNAPDS